MARVGLKTEAIALTADTVDRLIQCGSGDAALLYLYLLRTGGEFDRAAAQKALNWKTAQTMTALAHLQAIGLAEDNIPPERKNAPKPEDCPAYTTEDVTTELNTDNGFKALLEDVELRLGRKCSVTDLRILLELYDHLAMPAEVLMTLITVLIEETEAKYGPGRRPRLGEIKAHAYRWKRSGIDTLDAAEDWVKKQGYFRSQEGALLQAVGISGRPAVEAERRYLHQWAGWGFGPEAVHIAYERTVLRTGSMKWAYCNSILRRWNEKGAHTPEEIAAADRPAKAQAGKAPQQAPPARDTIVVPPNARRNAERMKQILGEDN